MTVSNQPIFPQAINVGVASQNNSTAGTAQTLFTAGTNGSKLESIVVTSTDTSARDLTVGLVRSATTYTLGVISIPAGAGNTDTIPGVDIMRNSQIPGFAYDNNGNRYMYLKNGDTITVNAATITSGKVINAVAQGGDF